jgi:hypothetical protein
MPPKQTPAVALPTPNSATVPVSVRETTATRTASFETFAGEPVNVIALAADRKDSRQVEIPRGFQNARIQRTAACRPQRRTEDRRGGHASHAGFRREPNAVAGAGTGPRERQDATHSASPAPVSVDRPQTASPSPPRQQPTAPGPPSKNSAESRLAVTPGPEPPTVRAAATPDVTRISHRKAGISMW